MHAIQLVLLAALTSSALPAAAQWQWIDGQGRKVFSDRAPGPEIPAKNILRQPGGGSAPAPAAAPSTSTPASAGDTAAAAPAPAAPAAAEKPGTDKGLEEQKRKAEAQDAAKARADKERSARQRQDNCDRARQAKASLSSGRLLAYTNAQGERGFMDDATREAEIKRADTVIAADCATR
jgi:hypothetical protein